MYEHFRSFYEDVFPEFTKAGKVMQFKVSPRWATFSQHHISFPYSLLIGERERANLVVSMGRFLYIFICDGHCRYHNIIHASNFVCALSHSPTMHSIQLVFFTVCQDYNNVCAFT